MASEYTTVNVVLYKSKTLASGEHPLMIRVSKNRVRKYIALGVSCHPKEWDTRTNLPKKSHPNKDLIDSLISKAVRQYKDEVINFKHEGKDFTPDVLIAIANKPVKKITVFKYFEEKIASLNTSNQLGNAKVYKDTYSRFKHFTGGHDLTFAQLDFDLLLKFETYFRSLGLLDNAISVRFRTLRALFNSAIDEHYVKRDLYPFDKFKISDRFNTITQKRAITKTDIKRIEALQLKEGSAAFEAQKYFIFSYYGQGINFVDIAKLKWKNLLGGRIFYKRAKTGHELNFVLNKPALDIIEFWKPLTKRSDESYIFPILNELIHKTATQKANRIHKVLTRVNQDLKSIGKTLEIETPLTSYVARHTFATVLKRSGVATAVISEALGHHTEAITQIYLKSFENSIIDQAMENLL